jgi:transcriptional regulator of acetoin/glycerol metabolism
LFFERPNGRLYPRINLFLVEYLVSHPLPRNTRQLKEILLHALRASEGDEIMLPELETVVEASRPPVSTTPSEKSRAGQISKEELLAALEKHGGVVSRAAKELRIGRTAMYEVMKRHGVNKEG